VKSFYIQLPLLLQRIKIQIMKNPFLVILISSFIGSCSYPRYDIVISNIGLFNGNEDVGIVNIGINSDSIAIISSKPIAADSIINGTGKYIIPGLVNSHVHIWEPQQLKAGYASGILAQIGAHASNVERDQKIKKVNKEEGYSHYFTSGFAATVPNGHPTQVSSFPIETINDSISVSEWVDNRIDEKVDFIKIVRDHHDFFQFPALPTLSYDQIEELINYTHSKKLKAVVHIGTLEEMVTIAKYKPDGFVHMWSYSDNASLTEGALTTLKESGAFVIPTALLIPRGHAFSEQKGGKDASWARENFISAEAAKEGIKRMHEKGIVILAGTDTGAQPFMMDYAMDLFAELQLYSESGLSNLEVLKTATGNAAKAWNIPIGKLEKGSKLNMLMLNGNPIDSLNVLKEINTIWKTGKTE
jgi:imidazolonepropionase-like amidohydrolase